MCHTNVHTTEMPIIKVKTRFSIKGYQLTFKVGMKNVTE